LDADKPVLAALFRKDSIYILIYFIYTIPVIQYKTIDYINIMNGIIKELLKLPQHEQRSPEWFEQRKDKLTSSDAATVLGINPYQKPHEVLFKKCGHDLKPFVGNIATEHGQKYEDEAIDKYCNIVGYTNYNFGLLCHRDIHLNETKYWLAGSPDGIVQDTQYPDSEPILLEIKCPYRRKIKMGVIPEYYYPQVQLNLYITKLKTADFIEYFPPSTMNIVRVQLDQSWIDKNVPILEAFWKEVEHYREIGICNHPKFPKKLNIMDLRDPVPEPTESEKQEDTIIGYNFRD